MSYMDHNLALAPAGGVQELSLDEIGQVSGGFVPLAFAAAVALTYVEFSFITGVFEGVERRERQRTAG